MRLLTAITALLLCVQPALGGQITLKNGDVITGKISAFDGSEYTVETDYIDGEFKVSADDVADIKTDTVMDVQYTDGEVMTGTLGMKDGAVVVVDESGDQTPIDVARIDEVAEVEDWFQWDADVHIGLSGAEGNTKNSLFHADASLEPQWGPNRFRFYGQLNEGTTTDQTTDVKSTTESNWRLLFQYNRDLSYRWYLFAANQWDSDKLMRLNARTSVAGGAGYKIWQEDYRDWWIELGPAYVHENWKNPTDDEDYVAARWALNFEHDIYSDDFRFYHNHNILESLQEFRFIFQSTTGIKFDLIGDLVGSLEVQFDYNSEPGTVTLSDGSERRAKKEDLRYMFKLGYEFGS